MNYTAEYFQAREQSQQHYRQAAASSGPPPATKKPTPGDGEEIWYLDGGYNNRTALSLISEIPAEATWALSRLVALSDEHNSRFVLITVPKLTEAILYAPLKYVKYYATQHESFSPFSPTPRTHLLCKHATESLLVLRNALHNELNVTHLVQDPDAISVIGQILQLPFEDERNTEMIIYALEILQILGPHMSPDEDGENPFDEIPINALERMVTDSMDRALLTHAINVLTLLMTPPSSPAPNAPPPYSPPYNPSADSPTMQRVLHFLTLVQDNLLLMAALEFLAAYLTSLPATQAFLLDPKLAQTLRLLAGVLRYEQRLETQTMPLGSPLRTAEREPGWLPYELSEEELRRIAPMPEPERSFQWMKKMFENAPGAELTQVVFWTLYKDTFAPLSEYAPSMLQAADIIRNVTIEFPEATASVVNDASGTSRFVILNIRRRGKPGSPLRFRCQWNGGTGCADANPTSPEELYQHLVTSHLALPQDDLSQIGQQTNALRCQWSTCDYVTSDPNSLRQHILTHIPTTIPAPKHPSQPPAVTLPSADALASDIGKMSLGSNAMSPLSRPPPPPPTAVLRFRTAPDMGTPSSIALLALYSLRMLFWASFADSSSSAPVHDEDKFGFPALPSIQQDLEKEEKEMEAGGEQVADPEIMWWVVDMVHRADESTEVVPLVLE
ncbi:hypothetical protein DL93DRAFT_2092778 [Clavulina sp. PMI_390]|nr:hypothetical protein DL93DRAFT_2092778 [Clavulina sp. PMI_390]